jgi:hypothetical protein
MERRQRISTDDRLAGELLAVAALSHVDDYLRAGPGGVEYPASLLSLAVPEGHLR